VKTICTVFNTFRTQARGNTDNNVATPNANRAGFRVITLLEALIMTTLNFENDSLIDRSGKLSLGARTTTLGTYGVFFALAVIYFWFGGMKFTHY
jgi:hypothetical protein